MTRGRVLAARNLLCRAIKSRGAWTLAAAVEPESRGGSCRVTQTERDHIGYSKRSPAQTLAIRAAFRAGQGDVSERVGTGVAIALGIGRAADAEGIENKEEGARHRRVHCCLSAAPDIGFCAAIGNSEPNGNRLAR